MYLKKAVETVKGIKNFLQKVRRIGDGLEFDRRTSEMSGRVNSEMKSGEDVQQTKETFNQSVILSGEKYKF